MLQIRYGTSLWLAHLSTGKLLIHDCKINGKACFEYNIISFAALINGSIQNFKISNLVFLAMDTQTGTQTSKSKYFSTKMKILLPKTSKKRRLLLEDFCISPTLVKHHYS